MFFFTFPYFNSIKVQLELISYIIVKFSILHFNSIKVQLELYFLSLCLLSYLFQFHKGTIRTR